MMTTVLKALCALSYLSSVVNYTVLDQPEHAIYNVLQAILLYLIAKEN